MTAICSHMDSIELTELPDEIAGCEDCLAIGEDWSWCYVDNVGFAVTRP